MPASFTDLQPEPVALAGSVDVKDNQGSALITLNLLATRQLLSSADLNEVLVNLSYHLNGNEEAARYQWQRFWSAVNFLQFLPVFYAWTPPSKTNGTAAGLLWPSGGQVRGRVQGQTPDPTPGEESAWFEHLDDELAAQLREKNARWPETALVGEPVTVEDDEVVGEAELMFEAEKIAFLLEDAPDQAAARPYLEAEGWRVLTGVEALVMAMNEMDAGV